MRLLKCQHVQEELNPGSPAFGAGAEAVSTEHTQVRVAMAWTREQAAGVTTALGACAVPGAVLCASRGLIHSVLTGAP